MSEQPGQLQVDEKYLLRALSEKLNASVNESLQLTAYAHQLGDENSRLEAENRELRKLLEAKQSTEATAAA